MAYSFNKSYIFFILFEYTKKFSNKGNVYLGGATKGNEWIKEENKVLGFINA